MEILQDPRSDGTTEGLLDVRSLCEAFQRTAAVDPTAIALRTMGGATEITWAEYAARVRRIAAGLAALGVGRGDTVALMMVNRPEFNLCDTAASTSVRRRSRSTTRCPPRTSPTSSTTPATGWSSAKSSSSPGSGPRPGSSTHLVCRRRRPRRDDRSDELERHGDPDFDFDAAWQRVSPDDLLTLIYTSGTTGPPKGVELTHANMLAELRATTIVLPVERGDRIMSYLPPAHIADRWSTHYQAMAFGLQITCVADPTQLGAALAEVRPDVWGAVPRIWEKFKAALESAHLGIEPAIAAPRRQAMRRRHSPGPTLGLDKARWLVSGAAPTSLRRAGVLRRRRPADLRDVGHVGDLPPAARSTRPGRAKLGTVGPALPGVELRLAHDGELLCRGPQVMRGYRKSQTRPPRRSMPDGWLHTGDVAEIDADGYVTIVDRKKELIINAAGKNMSPANIESEAQGVQRPDRPGRGHRRPSALQRRADRARPRRLRRLRRRSATSLTAHRPRCPTIRISAGRRRPRSAGQRTARPDRADQVLRHPARANGSPPATN